jgi:hypothetical protein
VSFGVPGKWLEMLYMFLSMNDSTSDANLAIEVSI